MAQGGDWGSMVARLMATSYPQHCVAVHVHMVVSGLPSIWTNPLALLSVMIWAPLQSATSLFGRMLWWQREESGYLEVQGTKPLTLSYGLVDSPIGMLAWILDKLHHLVGDDFSWEHEEVITWAMMYLILGNAGHASIYTNAKGEKLKDFTKQISRPLQREMDFGASAFSKNVCYVPRWWAGASISRNILFWKEHSKGGHFASLEKPAELVRGIQEFTEAIQTERKGRLVASGKLKR
ncbi:uncharacterized protein KD926_004610 [Aspergillus affinis]|uniref:uncharacterized protein n=1 Tax=Aspergillus affinis TaxID=1070780 RepID=UPI0022FEE94D|nr:uncharacterized protein KD926_004610 [Aspergillus affinis]KAI9043107.1 hypothetical protein KD926_004610 [Aspergillus affinis]